MKKFFTLMLALSLLMGCCAQAEIAIIGGDAEPLELNTPTMPSDELEFTALSFISDDNGYTHQTVKLTLTVQSWTMETIDAAQEISFEVRYDDFVFPGVCASGESVPIEMLMNGTIAYTVRIPNALIYGEEAESTEFILTVSDKSYSLAAKQLHRIEGIDVASGGNFFALVKSDGTLWAWGDNGFGQLGDNSKNNHSSPVQVRDNVVAVSAGATHTAVLLSDGTLWTCGYNGDGRLGDGTHTNSSAPVQVLDGVTSISAGAYHTAALRSDATLWTWGDNGGSQLGNGNAADKSLPGYVLDNVVSVSTGNYHTVALRSDGTLWGWGKNTEGQLGGITGNYQSTPAQMLTGVAKAAAGGTHTVVLLSDGSVYTTDYHGELQLLAQNAADIEAGFYSTLILDAAGTLWGCAHSEHGILGAGTRSSQPVVILENVVDFDVTRNNSIAVCADGSVWVWGEGAIFNGTSSSSPVKLDINAFS